MIENTSSLSPREVVEELDKYIIGQKEAKRAVAIALRNRWRRLQVEGELRDEISPKNILLIGPTGVGKTEISRRLAKLANAPFIKVEASKFTEVGYVGRDVESMVRDLAEMSVKLVRDEYVDAIKDRARADAEDRIAASIAKSRGENYEKMSDIEKTELLELLRSGALDDRYIDVQVPETSTISFDIFGGMRNNPDQENAFSELINKMSPKRKISKRLPVSEAFAQMMAETEEGLIDKESIEREALRRAEQMGIIFIDEIDKVASRSQAHGPEVSREGVQRDLLPIIEGSTVKTKYGFMRTDHILFIASGAFHMAKPSDLIPELQGRFPIRVTLNSLNREDFVRILTEPSNNLIKQYEALLSTEGITLEVTPQAIESMAHAAYTANEKMQNIGARRLHTVIERVFDEISYAADTYEQKVYTIDEDYVKAQLADLIEDIDLQRYIL